MMCRLAHLSNDSGNIRLDSVCEPLSQSQRRNDINGVTLTEIQRRHRAAGYKGTLSIFRERVRGKPFKKRNFKKVLKV